MNARRIKPILLHIAEDLEDIERFIQGANKDVFHTNSMLRKAVCMSLINIGEMSKQLPEALTSKYPDIPWNSIVGLRNRVAHGYHTLDTDIMWDIVCNDLTKFREVVMRELMLLDNSPD